MSGSERPDWTARERLDLLIASSGGTADDLAAQIGVTPSTLREYRSGRRPLWPASEATARGVAMGARIEAALGRPGALRPGGPCPCCGAVTPEGPGTGSQDPSASTA